MIRPHIGDLRIALYELSEICRVIAGVYIIPIIFSIAYAENFALLHLAEKISVFIVPAVVIYLLSLLFRRLRIDADIRNKHTLMAVALAWLIIALVGLLPFYLSGELTLIESFFESMSGWTTTGMTMVEEPSLIREDLVFYRGLMQWVGGIGVVALALMIFMKEGTVSMEYYAQEVGKQRLKPRIKDTIMETWKIYSMFTLACIVCLLILGLPILDSIAVSFSALSTGGFTPHAGSIGFYDNLGFVNSFLIKAVLIVFMIIGATSFLIHLRLFEGKIKTLLKNVEFKYMIYIILSSVFLITLFLYFTQGHLHLLQTVSEMGDALFHVVAAITCTGFGISDLSNWLQLPQSLLVFIMYIGGVYGSTAGGIKLLRFIVILKVLKHTFLKMILPKSAVLRIGINKRFFEYEEIVDIFGLCAVYLLVALAGTLVITFLGFEEMQAIFISFSAMGNVGLINVPAATWFGMSSSCKIVIALLMWIGRLEIFPIIVLLSPLKFREKR